MLAMALMSIPPPVIPASIQLTNSHSANHHNKKFPCGFRNIRPRTGHLADDRAFSRLHTLYDSQHDQVGKGFSERKMKECGLQRRSRFIH
jgi:hypothetical protein